ncbi:MAG: LCP family protein [Cyanothece sp. SIO2G6]|nr:LCP family protein [Cyanothece sp. SIO2G6]
MTQQHNNDTVPDLTAGGNFEVSSGSADASTESVDASAVASPPKQSGGLLKAALWSGAFVVTAIASATVGIVLGLTIPISDSTSEQTQPESIAELWRKGVRHQLVRPVNILVLGIDQVPTTDRPESLLDRDGDATVASTTHHPEFTSDLASVSSLDAEPLDAEPLDAEPGPFSDTTSAVDLERLAGRSDAMLLVQLDPDENTVNVMSIPRDTQVQFPEEVGVTKINHANLVGGPRLAAAVVSHNLGGMEIDRYVRVSTVVFRDLVDAVGGVEVTVPVPMQYTDQTQGLYIDLEAGKQVLMGDEAEQFARFRGDALGDIGRVQRQQQLIGALRDRLMSPTIIPRIPGIVQLLREHIDTNLTPEEFLAILNFSLDMERDNFRMVMLPGTFSQEEYVASYWLIDRPAVNQILEDYFQVQPSQLVAQVGLDQSFDQPIDAELSAEERDRALKSLRIAVQNASSDPAATGKLIRYLQSAGFTQVYRVGSLDETQLDTQIIVQRGNLRGAERLAQTMGQGEIVSASIGDLASDLTIRIGNDWQLPETDED